MGKRTELRQKRAQQKRSTLISVILGVGLITLAVIVLVALPKNDPTAQREEYSVTPVEVNYPAPELALENMNGELQALADFRQQVVLVNNWATWCPPCKAEMPTLVAFYNDHQAEGLMIVAIEAGEPKEEVQPFVEQFQMPFPVWLDPDGKALNAFKNGSLPNSYVIDRTGTVRLTWTGQISRAMLEKYVTPLLAE